MGGVMDGSTSNAFHGDAERVIQARDVYLQEAPAPTVPDPPRQLAIGPEPFVNRTTILARLDAALARERAPGSCGIVTLTGPGGVGKTATTMRWAHSVSAAHPDGQLYVDLGGLARRELAGIGDVLGQFLTALGVSSGDIPAGVDARAARYRTVAATKRLLVVLDNAESVAQVKDLLPASSRSFAVVTSGRSLGALRTMLGAELLTLAPLSVSDGVRLLAEMIGAERVADDHAAAESLVELCGRLPLAIRIAGGHLGARPDRPIARMVARLGRGRLTALSADEGEISVRAVCDESYEGLPDAAARMYRLLSLHPAFDARSGRPRRAAEFGAAVAAALAGLDVDDAEDLLDLLADRYLIEAAGASRYRMRGLLQEHARGLAERVESEDARDAAMRRAVETYLRFAVAHDRVVNPLRPVIGPFYAGCGPAVVSKKEALDRLDAERTNLRAAVHTAVDHGWDELAWQLCEALWGLYFSRKHYDDWIATHTDGMAAARRTGDPRALFRVGVQLGRALFESGRFAAAREALGEALTAARATGDSLNEATVLEFVGRSYLDEGEFAEAIGHLEQALHLEQAGGRGRGVAIDSHHLGRAHLALGRTDVALRYLDEAARLFASIPDPYNEARVLMSLGRLQLELGGHQAAEPLLKALTVMRAEGRLFQEAEILAALADTTDDADVARAYLEQAVTVYDRVGSPNAAELRSRLARPEIPGPRDAAP
jgi:tetratricopeptide (TPR) repeat protein